MEKTSLILKVLGGLISLAGIGVAFAQKKVDADLSNKQMEDMVNQIVNEKLKDLK